MATMKLNVSRDDIEFGSNILDIQVPDELRVRVSTGLKFVDDAYGGKGFTPSAVTLFTGTPGAGKTTMVLTMANLLTRAGHQVVFNTGEESLYQTKLVAERLQLGAGFMVGQETSTPDLLEKLDRIRQPGKQFFLFQDSLQTLTDGKHADGGGGAAKDKRCLAMITDWCKENYTHSLVIGQVNKSGKMAGSNVLKHMVDAMLELSVEEKDPDLAGCRVLEMTKNRFGGCGGTFYLTLRDKGFKEVARISAF